MSDARLLLTIRAELREAGRALDLPQETCRCLVSRLEDSLLRDFGGSRVYVPAKRQASREEGLRMLREGVSIGKVARRLHVHRSTVYRWYQKRQRLDYPPRASRRDIIR